METSVKQSECCKSVKPENAARMFSNPAPVLSNAMVMKLLDAEVSKRILEVGAGCLRNAIHVMNMGHLVTVLEVPPMRDRFPEQYEKFERSGGKILQSLTPRSRFDIAISTFVIETICNHLERVTLLRDIYAHLTSGGVLILSARGPRDLLTALNNGVRCGDGYLTPNRSFARSYTREQMKALLKKGGFSDLVFLHKQESKEPEYLHVIARKNA